jgi:A/G-specific adenine glycosylase
MYPRQAATAWQSDVCLPCAPAIPQAVPPEHRLSCQGGQGCSGWSGPAIAHMGTRGMSRHLTQSEIRAFREVIWRHYGEHGRRLPWRETTDPYEILVSEVMLQQTQVSRVVGKYREFLEAFPTIQALATASLAEILRVWQGLGYNRRALALHRLARIVVETHGGSVPDNIEALKKLPGIGHATASAICAFAFNQAVVFVETNIRSVFIHHFFAESASVSDKHILPLVADTLDGDRPREWYWALMDYGVTLKERFGNPSRRSAHHVRQSPFEGSDRQVRGATLRILASRCSVTEETLRKELGTTHSRLASILHDLANEGFITRANGAVGIVGESSEAGRSPETT